MIKTRVQPGPILTKTGAEYTAHSAPACIAGRESSPGGKLTCPEHSALMLSAVCAAFMFRSIDPLPVSPA